MRSLGSTGCLFIAREVGALPTQKRGKMLRRLVHGDKIITLRVKSCKRFINTQAELGQFVMIKEAILLCAFSFQSVKFSVTSTERRCVRCAFCKILIFDD